MSTMSSAHSVLYRPWASIQDAWDPTPQAHPLTPISGLQIIPEPQCSLAHMVPLYKQEKWCTLQGHSSALAAKMDS